MPLARTCSECGTVLAGKSVKAKTCSNACRLRRSKRLRRISKEQAEMAEVGGVSEIAAMVRRESPDIAQDVLRKELAPIVRQALTEDVLQAINSLVGLTPRAVQALHEDLECDDRVLRQRAYTLLFKYTTGHPALVKPDDTNDQSQIVVNFNLPRPDSVPEELAADVVELRICDMCGEEKPETEFETGSDRCTPCFEAWRETVKSQFIT